MNAPQRWIAGAAVLLNGFFPALWMLTTSFKSENELTRTPITWLPAAPTFDNYIHVFQDQPIGYFILNSLAVSTLSGLLTTVVAVMAAYALARLDIRYRLLVLSSIVAVSTFPPVTVLVPLFDIFRRLDLLNTYAALVLPYTVFSLPVCTLVLMTFFQTIPPELESAAMVDGCTRLGALWRIVLPLSLPGLATAGIFAFVNAWDEFLLALSFNSGASLRTLAVGVTLYQGEFSFPWHVISAAIVVGLLPVLTLVVVFQRRIMSGLVAGGVKG